MYAASPAILYGIRTPWLITENPGVANPCG